LARAAAVGRQWIFEIEAGKPRAELGRVLQTLAALELSLTIHGEGIPELPQVRQADRGRRSPGRSGCAPAQVPMTGRLIAVANGRLLGEITRDTRGRLCFTYDAAWRSDDTAYPLSLSMPLTASGHGHDRIEPWLWGLLPDNENVLARWARRFQVTTRTRPSARRYTAAASPVLASMSTRGSAIGRRGRRTAPPSAVVQGEEGTPGQRVGGVAEDRLDIGRVGDAKRGQRLRAR